MVLKGRKVLISPGAACATSSRDKPRVGTETPWRGQPIGSHAAGSCPKLLQITGQSLLTSALEPLAPRALQDLDQEYDGGQLTRWWCAALHMLCSASGKRGDGSLHQGPSSRVHCCPRCRKPSHDKYPHATRPGQPSRVKDLLLKKPLRSQVQALNHFLCCFCPCSCSDVSRPVPPTTAPLDGPG